MPETCRVELDQAPELTDLAAQFPQKYPFLLDSAAPGPLGRNSLLLHTEGEFLTLHQDGSLGGSAGSHADLEGTGFLDAFHAWYLRESVSPEPLQVGSGVSVAAPFIGGWFVFLSYELAAEIEPVLKMPAATDGLPVALAARCRGAILVHHDESGSRAQLIAETPGLLREMQKDLASCGKRPPHSPAAIAFINSEPDEYFVSAVERVKQYLVDGDVFQVNLSRAWNGAFARAVHPVDMYLRLRQSNPAPFAGLMQWNNRSLLSSSPERLVEVRGREIQVRPIAGTYPRGADLQADQALSRDLLAHPKERAEHIMLIDLERNDLGRVCMTGSVEVSELMVVESYTHVHHIVSNVRGLLKEAVSPAQVLRAVFPGGTITGCPKVRCMQIISELEQSGRGFYTGSMGYISRDGQMDMNILIRSMLLTGKAVTLRTGAGIVADSDPERELAETVAKARGLLNALGGTHA